MTHFIQYSLYIKRPSLLPGHAVCPGSSDPFYIASLIYKMDHYFLDILYSSNSLYKMDHDSLDRHYLPTYTCTYVREVLMLFHIVTVRTAYLGKSFFPLRLVGLIQDFTFLSTILIWFNCCCLNCATKFFKFYFISLYENGQKFSSIQNRMLFLDTSA